MTETLSITIPKTYSLSIKAIEDTIDTAGYGIGYWASSAVIDNKAQTYTVTDAEGDGETYALTYQNIFEAILKLSNGEADIRKDIAHECAVALLDYEEASIDSETADCIIQVACFGELIYG